MKWRSGLIKTKRTRKHVTLNSLTETAILSLVAKLGQKCNSLHMEKPKNITIQGR